MTDERRECGEFVSWWEGEYEGNCELPAGHERATMHFDGLSWFDDDMEEVEADRVPEAPRKAWRP